jgi:hypothetical protein
MLHKLLLDKADALYNMYYAPSILSDAQIVALLREGSFIDEPLSGYEHTIASHNASIRQAQSSTEIHKINAETRKKLCSWFCGMDITASMAETVANIDLSDGESDDGDDAAETRGAPCLSTFTFDGTDAMVAKVFTDEAILDYLENKRSMPRGCIDVDRFRDAVLEKNSLTAQELKLFVEILDNDDLVAMINDKYSLNISALDSQAISAIKTCICRKTPQQNQLPGNSGPPLPPANPGGFVAAFNAPPPPAQIKADNSGQFAGPADVGSKPSAEQSRLRFVTRHEAFVSTLCEQLTSYKVVYTTLSHLDSGPKIVSPYEGDSETIDWNRFKAFLCNIGANEKEANPFLNTTLTDAETYNLFTGSAFAVAFSPNFKTLLQQKGDPLFEFHGFSTNGSDKYAIIETFAELMFVRLPLHLLMSVDYQSTRCVVPAESVFNTKSTRWTHVKLSNRVERFRWSVAENGSQTYVLPNIKETALQFSRVFYRPYLYTPSGTYSELAFLPQTTEILRAKETPIGFLQKIPQKGFTTEEEDITEARLIVDEINGIVGAVLWIATFFCPEDGDASKSYIFKEMEIDAKDNDRSRTSSMMLLSVAMAVFIEWACLIPTPSKDPPPTKTAAISLEYFGATIFKPIVHRFSNTSASIVQPTDSYGSEFPRNVLGAFTKVPELMTPVTCAWLELSSCAYGINEPIWTLCLNVDDDRGLQLSQFAYERMTAKSAFFNMGKSNNLLEKLFMPRSLFVHQETANIPG